MTRKIHWQVLIIISLLFFPAFADPGFAWDYEQPVIVNAYEAYDRSLRDGRDAVEGFWAIYMEWQPERARTDATAWPS